jgi:hypothetical protein
VTFLLDDPMITVDPATGGVGTEVTITGSGFQPQTGFTTFTVGTTSLSTVGLITDTLGAFTTTAMIPGLAEGAQTITVVVGSDTATTFFTVSAAAASVATQLASVSNELVIVWTYTADGWQLYDPADPIGSDLASLSDGGGYWIKVTEACTVIYLGKSRIITPDANGWAMMGW